MLFRSKATLGVNCYNHAGQFLHPVTGETQAMNMVLWDIEGGQQKSSMLNTYLIGAAGALLIADLTRPIVLSAPLDFAGGQPGVFGVSPATSETYTSKGFTGSVTEGGAVNVRVLHVSPHTAGTHTESDAHITVNGRTAFKAILVPKKQAIDCTDLEGKLFWSVNSFDSNLTEDWNFP